MKIGFYFSVSRGIQRPVKRYQNDPPRMERRLF